ncbi:MAG: hypothetical protein GXY86_01770 [Firmicutes bacterium]|nr:hypothetical protein [Bacillota bacterium]
MELEDQLHAEIISLCSEGDQLVEINKYNEAIEKYIKALNLIPEPKTDWEASTWIYTALGDTCFINGNFVESKDYFYDAINCPGGMDNPFIILHLGESLFELGDLEKAKEYLMKAYMLEGYDVFDCEDEKYYLMIKNLI